MYINQETVKKRLILNTHMSNDIISTHLLTKI